MEYRYSDLTGKIIGASMMVHSTLGPGFPEVIYQRALKIELVEKGVQFQKECEMPVYYRNNHIGTRRVDFLVANLICVELKAVKKLDDTHLAQTLNYLEAFKMEIGLLINFGAKSLEYKRLINHRLTTD